MRMTGDEAMAQEATQDAFIRAFRSLGQFRGEAAFATWIYRISISATLNLVKKRKRWRARHAGIEDAELVAHGGQIADPHLKARLYAAIDATARCS